MELLRTCPFDLDKSKKLGHMRCDFDGGSEFRPFKTWFGTGEWQQKCDNFGIDVKELDEAINLICSDKIDRYSKLLKYTGHLDNPYDSVNYYYQYKNIDVWLRLIPAKDDYNMYISLYHQ